MLVYRIEHRETGIGPFHDKSNLLVKDAMNFIFAGPRPVVSSTACCCGCISLESLLEWFDLPIDHETWWSEEEDCPYSEVLEMLLVANFIVRIYEIDERHIVSVFDDGQLLFKKEKGKLVQSTEINVLMQMSVYAS